MNILDENPRSVSRSIGNGFVSGGNTLIRSHSDIGAGDTRALDQILDAVRGIKTRGGTECDWCRGGDLFDDFTEVAIGIEEVVTKDCFNELFDSGDETIDAKDPD